MIYVPYASASVAAGAELVNRHSVAALAFLVWDVLITFEDEVRLIWPRAWNYTKFAFFFVRYIPVIIQISILLIGSELSPHFHFTHHGCFIWQVYQGVAASAVVLIVDTILILRVHALYHGNSIVRRAIALLFFIEVVGIVVGLALSLPGIKFDDICLVMGGPMTLIVYGVVTATYQTILFLLTLFKFLQALRSGWGDVPLIVLLMRDGTWAFFMLFLIYVGQLLLYTLENGAYTGALYGWFLTAYSFSGYRILLNISHLGEVPLSERERRSGSQATDANIQFTTLAPGTTLGQSVLTTWRTSLISYFSSSPRSVSSLELTPTSQYRSRSHSYEIT